MTGRDQRPEITVIAPARPRQDLTDIRAIWWRLRRRHGVPLPAETGVISIIGGRT